MSEPLSRPDLPQAAIEAVMAGRKVEAMGRRGRAWVLVLVAIVIVLWLFVLQ